ncbi:MAG: hypothetical protein RLZZ175_2122 [Bacteroidota bacterium]|jgi:hypothetical protein
MALIIDLIEKYFSKKTSTAFLTIEVGGMFMLFGLKI